MLAMISTPVVLWSLVAVICVWRGHQPIEQAKQAPDADGVDQIALVASANKEFAFRLYRILAGLGGSEGKNIIFSPFSISVALAALSVGARGKTHQQLFSGLGFNSTQMDQTGVGNAFRTFIGSMASKDSSQGTAVFMENLFKPKPDFLNFLKQWYFTESFSVDFTKPKESAYTINQYVSGKTNGKIKELVKELVPSTVLYLISYIYFKGTWETQFDPKLTGPDVFKVDEDTEVIVQMMRREGVFDTYYDQALDASVLRLPFRNSLTMLLVLPENITIAEDLIGPGDVNRWLEGMKPRTYMISVPKFSIKISNKLNDVLAEMGMVDMFGDRADLSGISEGRRLKVYEVVHQATLDVDEAGATAAAATGVEFDSLSELEVPELKFNCPFVVVITENSYRNILFMGKVVNPNV